MFSSDINGTEIDFEKKPEKQTRRRRNPIASNFQMEKRLMEDSGVVGTHSRDGMQQCDWSVELEPEVYE